MNSLLRVSRLIDALNTAVGKASYWLILVAVLISSGNAVVRKAFNMSSNSLLEIQWYLFAAVFLLCAGYTLLNKEHVRVDLIHSRLTRRKQLWVEIFGTLFFLAQVSRVELLFGAALLVAGLVFGVVTRLWRRARMQ